MELFKDIYKFIASLTFIDVVFFTAVIALLVLIVTLIYFIKLNKDVLSEDDLFPPMGNEKKIEKIESKSEEVPNNLNPEKVKEEEMPDLLGLSDDEEGELLDLESLTKKLKAEEESGERVLCNKYEQDQEEKAIISYDELLKKHNKYAINYEKEEVIDDLIVKKVNLNDLTNKEQEETVNSNIQVISYAQEEAFLSALKELNSLLN